MEIRIDVDNRVRVRGVSTLDRAIVAELKRGFEHENPEWMKKRRMGLPVWGEKKVIVSWKEDRAEDALTFPRGGFSRVERILTEVGHDVAVHDARQHGVHYEAPEHRLTLYPHQRDAIAAVLENEQGIIRAPTGSGKSSTILALASILRVPTLVVVHSQALLDQWKERAIKELGLKPSQVGIVQGQKFNLRPLTLTIQKTMAKVAAESREVRDYFGCVMMDECHLAAASSFIESVDPFPARYRIGASADHRRKDRKEFLIYDLFGDVIADVDRGALVKSGHVLDVEIRAVPTDFVAPWYGVPDDKGDDKRIDFVRLVKEMAEDPVRNMAAVRLVRDEVTRGEQVFVMCHEREHCMRLGQMLVGFGLRAGYLMGGPESAKEFAETLEGLRSGRLQVGVGTYKAIGTGIDIPRIGVAVGVTPIAGNQQFFGQVRGRVCRTAKGKTAARLYVLWDREVYRRHLRNLMAWNDRVTVRDEAGDYVPAKEYAKVNGL